ncbi:hypothetical protein [Bradyrhizobium sp. McL0616]|uniref:hypothetical protein n=1 Tax=Bradyrhizobium sp. McL0616 TaxID=3415674 RepID=UPI003CF52D32
MKNLIRGVGFFVGLLYVAPASAQIYLPTNLPPYTLVGNLRGIGAPGYAVTMSELATALNNQGVTSPDGTIRSNISGAPGPAADNTISAVLDKLFGTTQGTVIYRGTNTAGWSALPPGPAGQFLSTNGPNANPSWANLPISGLSNSLGADVSLNSIGAYFAGPSITQGTSGTWSVTATATVLDTAGAASFNCRITDGINVVASSRSASVAASASVSISLSGLITSPAANLRLECADTSNTGGFMKANASGSLHDTMITAIRLGN